MYLQSIQQGGFSSIILRQLSVYRLLVRSLSNIKVLTRPRISIRISFFEKSIPDSHDTLAPILSRHWPPSARYMLLYILLWGTIKISISYGRGRMDLM
jgi:hypothetical protein